MAKIRINRFICLLKQFECGQTHGRQSSDGHTQVQYCQVIYQLQNDHWRHGALKACQILPGRFIIHQDEPIRLLTTAAEGCTAHIFMVHQQQQRPPQICLKTAFGSLSFVPSFTISNIVVVIN